MQHTQTPQQPVVDTVENKQSLPGGKEKIQPEFTSFVSLFLIGLVVVLGVLLFNEKTTKEAPVINKDVVESKQTVMTYKMPEISTVIKVVSLPDANLKGTMSVEETIQNRRSKRFYSDEPVTKQELSQVLWSAQGITDKKGHRAAPSAKGAYPFSLYVVIRNVEGVDAGLYLYNPADHTLGDLGMANAGERLIQAGVQSNSKTAPVVLGLVASPAKMMEKFPDSDPMSKIYLEGGHIGQNIYLQIESLNMATVVTAGFNPNAVAEALKIDPVNQNVVYLVPFGHIGEAPEQEAN